MAKPAHFFPYFRAVRAFIKASRIVTGLHNLSLRRLPSPRFWTWEVYGLGVSLKDLLELDQSLVLSLGSDHGINLTTVADEMEESLGGAAYVTWSAWRAGIKFQNNRHVILIQHPWVGYRNKHNLKPKESRRGTLAFVPHSAPGVESDKFDIFDYASHLLELPEKFQPITLCLHVHDLDWAESARLLSMGVSVDTVGHSLSPAYTRRFYSLVSRYEYATSPIAGSQLFYVAEFGIDYFLFNPTGYQQNLRDYKGPPLDAGIVQRIEKAFSLDGYENYELERVSITREALGLDFPAARSPIREHDLKTHVHKRTHRLH